MSKKQACQQCQSSTAHWAHRYPLAVSFAAVPAGFIVAIATGSAGWIALIMVTLVMMIVQGIGDLGARHRVAKDCRNGQCSAVPGGQRAESVDAVGGTGMFG